MGTGTGHRHYMTCASQNNFLGSVFHFRYLWWSAFLWRYTGTSLCIVVRVS